MTVKRYELLEHTADLGIRVWGKDQKDLFLNAAAGMYSLIADILKVMPKSYFEVKINAQDKDQLLKDWLSELLYYFNVKDTLLSKFEIEQIDDTSIKSKVKGEKVNTAKHKLYHEVKAVTYHNLHIEEKKGLLTTEIIFDV